MIRGPKSQDICYATENRQMAVKGVAQFCDLLLVVGSANSSNSKRLVEVGQNYGVQVVSGERLERSAIRHGWRASTVSALRLARRLPSIWWKTSSPRSRTRVSATGRSGDGGRRRAVLAAAGTDERASRSCYSITR